MSITDKIKKILGREPLKPGMYSYIGRKDFEGFRFHLRVEKDGSGILVINAARILFLNETATEYMKLMLESGVEDVVVKEIVNRFKVDEKTARADYKRMSEDIKNLVKAQDINPEAEGSFEKSGLAKKELGAPLMANLVLTYRMNDNPVFNFADPKRASRELTADEWKKVIDNLFEGGVPHVNFVGGEPTLRDDLPDLIAYAEEKGIITGLLTDGRKMSDKEYLLTLIKAGIDHFQIQIESHDEKVHDKLVKSEGAFKETVAGIKNAVVTPIYTVTNTTIVPENLKDIEKTIDFIKGLGINVFGFNLWIEQEPDKSKKAPEKGKNIVNVKPAKEYVFTPEKAKEAMERIINYCKKVGVKPLWYQPIRHSVTPNLPKEMAGMTPSCQAGTLLIAVEPDADVVPCQIFTTVVGNLLNQPLSEIWENKILKELRKENNEEHKCSGKLCGGCPIGNIEGSYTCLESRTSG